MGDVGDVVTLLQPGGPVPASGWDGVVLAQSEEDPLLLPGDSVFLLLSAHGEHFSVQPTTGHYRLDSEDRVAPLSSNPFAAELRGLTVDGIASKVTEIARPAP